MFLIQVRPPSRDSYHHITMQEEKKDTNGS